VRPFGNEVSSRRIPGAGPGFATVVAGGRALVGGAAAAVADAARSAATIRPIRVLMTNRPFPSAPRCLPCRRKLLLDEIFEREAIPDDGLALI
jgi:hypothetical protein